MEMHIGRPRTLHQRLDDVELAIDKLTGRLNLLFGALGAIGVAIAISQWLGQLP